MIIIQGTEVFNDVDKLPHVGRPDILHIFTSEKSIGGKLNFGCDNAKGNIILRMDSDDLYDRQWISKSVQALIESKAALTGLSNALFLNSVPEAEVEDLYEHHYTGPVPYVIGATMCFWKDTWREHPFLNISEGEDHQFCTKLNTKSIKAHNEDKDKFIAVIHGENTACQKQLIFMRKLTQNEQDEIFNTGNHNNSLGLLLQKSGYIS